MRTTTIICDVCKLTIPKPVKLEYLHTNSVWYEVTYSFSSTNGLCPKPIDMCLCCFVEMISKHKNS